MNIIRQAMGVIATKDDIAKYRLEDSAGRVCVNGALNQVVMGNATTWGNRDDQWTTARDILGQVAFEQFPERFPEGVQTGEWQPMPEYFNNHEATTKEEMLRVMDKAAVKLDEMI